jgi:hypothetical protein
VKQGDPSIGLQDPEFPEMHAGKGCHQEVVRLKLGQEVVRKTIEEIGYQKSYILECRQRNGRREYNVWLLWK